MMLRWWWAIKCFFKVSADRRWNDVGEKVERRVPKDVKRMKHADEVLATAIMDLSEALKEKQK